MAKRLRLDYPYEMTAQEWKEVQRETKGYQKKMEEIEKLKDAIAKETRMIVNDMINKQKTHAKHDNLPKVL